MYDLDVHTYVENINWIHLPNKMNTYYIPAKEHISIQIIINPCVNPILLVIIVNNVVDISVNITHHDIEVIYIL